MNDDIDSKSIHDSNILRNASRLIGLYFKKISVEIFLIFLTIKIIIHWIMQIPAAAVNHYKSVCENSHIFDEKYESKVPKFDLNGTYISQLFLHHLMSLHRTFGWKGTWQRWFLCCKYCLHSFITVYLTIYIYL